MRDAIAFHVEGLRESGQPSPEPLRVKATYIDIAAKLRAVAPPAAISGHAPLGRFERRPPRRRRRARVAAREQQLRACTLAQRRGTARRAGSCARAAWPAAGRRAPISPADRELEPRLLAAKCAGQVTFETGAGPVCRSAADEAGRSANALTTWRVMRGGCRVVRLITEAPSGL
jgi:hypothetical protein